MEHGTLHVVKGRKLYSIDKKVLKSQKKSTEKMEQPLKGEKKKSSKRCVVGLHGPIKGRQIVVKGRERISQEEEDQLLKGKAKESINRCD